MALRKEEPIGVVALSGAVNRSRLDEGLARLRATGHPVILAPNLDSRRRYLAGSDRERLDGLNWVLDRGARTILSARGGYGSLRLHTDLPWERLEERRVRFIGFSDLSWLLNLMASRGIPQVHGPMCAAGLVREGNAKRLLRVLSGAAEGDELFRFKQDQVVKGGRCRGIALGGNVSTLTSVLGLPCETDFTGAVLFLEDVNEPWYRLDRLLTQLAGAGRLQNVNALITGSLHGCRPADGRAQMWRDLLCQVAPPHALIVTGLPFGHAARNDAFPVGVEVSVDTDRGQVLWR